MKRNIVETVLGAIVLMVAGIFLVFSYSAAGVGDVDGYMVTADFTGTGGLNIGDSVQISGVRIGNVAKIDLDPQTYRARVTMSIENAIRLPDDTSALISSESLLGGKYLELQPGASEDYLSNGGHIEYTQAPQNLEQLLGKFIFSMEGGSNANKETGEEPALDAAPVEDVQPTPAPEADISG